MRIKPHILTIASTATLRQIVDDFEIEVSDKRKREVLQNAISSARRCKPEELLAFLSEQEIKQVCEAAGVDQKGRRITLIERLIEGSAPAPEPRVSSEPKLASTQSSAAKTNYPKRKPMNDNQSVQGSLQIDSPETGVASVDKYEFEPIKGYPMLNWRGKRPFTSTQYYPAQLKEVHGEEIDGWRNKIYWGDNLQVMSHLLKQFRGKVDLIYIDPPFDSNADYKKKVKLKGGQIEGEQNAFEEKQYSDIWTNDEYLQFMFERLVILRELLSPEGSIYIHCDWGKSHYLRCLMDEIFGSDRCMNEITWKRTSARSDSKTFNHIHDTIFFYTKSPTYHFNAMYVPHDPAYIEKYYSYSEPDGRRFATIDATQSGLRNGSSGETWRGFSPAAKGNHWKFATSELDRLDAEGRIYWPSKEGGWPRLKSYLDELQGAAIQSIWSDIKAVNSQAAERLDYPTQKPEPLLERIISASSSPGDIVFDCFMGSGTTQAVAMKLGRRFIGADINLGSVQTSTKRLLQIAASSKQGELIDGGNLSNFAVGFEVHNVNNYDIFRNPVQAKELLIEALEVQKLEFSTVFDGEKDGRMVKIMPVNRIATRADLNELIAGFDYKGWQRKQNENPNRAIEKITLVCMGHEADLAAQLQLAAKPFKVDVEVVDILRDKAELEFKRDSQAKVGIKKGKLVIEKFFPMNLLQKLSLQKESVEDWRELVESVLIDWNYDGAVLQPAVVDIPGKDELVKGTYQVPEDAATIHVKITDLLSESWEGSVSNGN